jgi:hypothetical protein
VSGQARSKLLPPYANQIDQADDLVVVYCGPRAWKLAAPAQDRVASLIFPAGRDPQAYAWPVAGKEVLVLGQAEPRMSVDFLVIELLRNDASLVYVDYEADGDIICYDPRERRVA